MIVAPPSMVTTAATMVSSSTEEIRTVTVSGTSVPTANVVVAPAEQPAEQPAEVVATQPASEEAAPAPAPVPAPDSPTLSEGEVLIEVNGEKVVCSPLIHVFRNGQPVLKKDGYPKNKPGPTKKADAGTPTVTVTTVAVAAEPKTRKPRKTSVATDAAPDAAAEDAAQSAVAPAESNLPTHTPAVATAANAPIREAFVATVNRTYGTLAKQEVTEETVEVKGFVVPPAHIEVGYGLTLNLGNYESARIDVKMNIPCYREEADDAYEHARQWAEQRIRREVAEVRALVNKTPTPTF